MAILQKPTKTRFSSPLINLILLLSSVSVIYLCVSVFVLGTSNLIRTSDNTYIPTDLEHIVFGIASNKKSWSKRKEYVRLWWKPLNMRGCVFLDSNLSPEESNSNDTTYLPPLCVSEDTSRFRYTFRNGLPSAIRAARVVKETVALNYSNVRWFVFGDDDTVFIPQNLAKTLGKYDDGLWYYIGSSSEIYKQNIEFGFDMAFGGAGFAISYPLGVVLANVFDTCIQRYPHLYGSDSRITSCLAELGVALTHEQGFHQIDLRGNLMGLLASHPLPPLVSLHHLDHIDPIYPNMTTMNAIEHFIQAANTDPHRILQRTVCYDRWFSWTISVSWGYAVQVFDRHILLPDLLPAQKTFRQWKSTGELWGVYTFNTVELHPDPCRRPTIFFLDTVSSTGGNGIISSYKQLRENCSFDMNSPKKLEEIKVLSQKLDLDIKQLLSPRRQCCDILPSSAGKVMEIAIRECKEDELIRMHP